jgi:hypothetical protein
LILEESKIKRLQSSLAGLRASGVADHQNVEAPGLDKPEYSIWIADSAGVGCMISFSNPFNETDDRYAVVEGKGIVFKVPKSTFDRIFEDQFKKPEK